MEKKKTIPERIAEQRTLIIASRQGDESALMRLVEMHGPKIEYLVQSMPRHYKPSQLDDLRQAAVVRLIEIIIYHFDLEKGVLLWTYAEIALRRHLYRTYPPRPEGPMENEMPSAIPPETPAKLSVAFHNLQRHIHRCLQDPVLANKWTVLILLRRGLAVRWNSVATYLQQESYEGLFSWDVAYLVCDPRFGIPSDWLTVCVLFKQGRDRRNRVVPKLTVPSLKKWYTRVTKRCCEHYPDVLSL